ncbi:MAG TPA: transposase [Frankiaceae bacterium]|jgi:hypothetical protein|nr:transposase [Frankiaceae bacterium]
MTVSTVAPRHDAAQVASLLDLPEVRRLVSELDYARWTGRPGYGNRVMVGAALVKAVYALPTWSRTCRLIGEHAALREAIGGAPSQDACYRFTKRLGVDGGPLARCLDAVVAALAAALPDYGVDLAVDGSDLPAYANGQKYVSKGGALRKRFSDPDASWGHRSSVGTRSGGGYYGFKLHAAVCSRTGLPVAWAVDTARNGESPHVPALLDTATRRGLRVETCAMDRGYDNGPLHDALAARDVRPVVPLTNTIRVKRGDHLPPACSHGQWTFAGADSKRGASKWRCPTGECQPKSVWVKADRLHPLIPRESARFRSLYKGRASVEREFGRLKNEWGLKPLRVRGLRRVQVHADLVILTRLAATLAAERDAAAPLAA